jgi:hypothetical protein
MRTRMTIIAAGILVAAAASSVVATASAVAATPSGSAAVASAAKPAPSGGRNVRRVPAVIAQDLQLSAGCFGETLPIDCRIDEPVVNQPQFTYDFSFVPGDHVTVDAGGCVQVGGHGDTWKRYVDPASDNDLYHGLITIPGATGILDRLVNVVGRQLVVRGRGGGNLVLGYQDDGYSDNGYNDHDNGTGNQCLNSVNAFVHIVVT